MQTKGTETREEERDEGTLMNCVELSRERECDIQCMDLTSLLKFSSDPIHRIIFVFSKKGEQWKWKESLSYPIPATATRSLANTDQDDDT